MTNTERLLRIETALNEAREEVDYLLKIQSNIGNTLRKYFQCNVYSKDTSVEQSLWDTEPIKRIVLTYVIGETTASGLWELENFQIDRKRVYRCNFKINDDFTLELFLYLNSNKEKLKHSAIEQLKDKVMVEIEQYLQENENHSLFGKKGEI